MKFSHSSSSSSLLLFLASFTSAATIPRRQNCNNTAPSNSSSQALYFLDNNPAGSSVISLQISPSDGTISNPIRTSTGGNGAIGLTANGPAETDSLFSQDSVVVAGNHLFTVNTGSNTLSHFLISPSDPQNLTLVGEPIPTLGTFPNSVAFSEKLNLVCVLHTGFPKPGVSCFRLDPETNEISTTPEGGCLIPLDSINQREEGPPTGPTNTGSDILFNPSSTALFVTTKGDPSTNTSGSVFTFPIDESGGSSSLVGTTPIESKPDGLLLEFSMTFLNESAAVVTDPSFGAALISTSSASASTTGGDDSIQVQSLVRTPIANQTATCWSVYSNSRQEIYVSDAGKTDMTVLDAQTGSIKRVLVGPADSKGNLDSVLVGSRLYVLQGASGISVFDVDAASAGAAADAAAAGDDDTTTEEQGQSGAAGAMVVQSLDLSALGDRRGWMGMAAFRGQVAKDEE